MLQQLLFNILLTLPAAAVADIDWNAQGDAAAGWLSRYIQVDTTNPPGNEIRGARFLKQEFDKIGIEARILPTGTENRVNLVAVLEGTGEERPVILTHHMDVVGASAEKWKHPPFSGKIVEGEVWGRGAIDMKGSAAAHFQVMKLLSERDAKLKRDVIFLAVADEEDGGIGSLWMKDEGLKLLGNAEFLINEGATIRREGDKTVHYGVSTMEKAVYWLRLVAEGRAGHGSEPIDGSAIRRLTAAVRRIQEAEWPIRLKPSVAGFFRSIARREKKWRKQLTRVKAHLNDPKFVRFLSDDPLYNALLRNTVTVTSLKAGGKVNVIPGRAEATLDCRLLPGETKEKFLPRLKKVIADDSIRVEEILYWPTAESPVDTDLMAAIRKVAARHDPGVPVVAQPLTSTTDSSVFRRMGITSYGFEPFKLSEEELSTAHGANERISVENLRFGTRFLYELVLELGGGSSP